MIFVVRLSAIGDVIIASEQVAALVHMTPDIVFVTSDSTRVIAESANGLRYMAIYDNGALNFFERVCDEQPRINENSNFKSLTFAQLFEKMDANACHQIFDFQSTGRSRRCVRTLKKTFKGAALEVKSVHKRSWYRWWLIVVSRFRSQSKRQMLKPFADIVSIAELQSQLVKEHFGISQHQQALAKVTQAPLQMENSTPPLKSLIVLCPGASGSLKQWPKEHFQTLRQLILDRTDAQVIILGGKDDLEMANYINHPPSVRSQNLVGKLALKESLEVMQHANHIVTGDSFAAHYAAAHDIACSVLFGATSPEFGFVSKHPKTKLHWLGLGCSPCSRHGKGECRYQNLKCLRDISPDSVFQSIQHI